MFTLFFQEHVNELKHKYWVKMGYVGFYALTERKHGLCYFHCQLDLHTLCNEILVVGVVSSYLLTSELFQS